jgi:dimethylglycine dehydrogenase
MKQHARVVIIGGGVTGCGLAYHLTKLGWSDVVLVEKNELTAGATWHAAGHVMHYAASALLTRLQKETTDLFPVLESETGQPVGFHQTGAIRLISTAEQKTEFRRAVAKAAALGVDMDIVSPAEAKRLFPLLVTEGLAGALHTPGDGHVDPSSLTFAFAKGARQRGAEFHTQAKVTGISRKNDEWVVETAKGTIRAEYVVNCAGMWAPEISAMLGVKLPLIVFMHQHLVTQDHPAVKTLERELVLLRDPAGGFNCRQEGKGLLSGVYEHAPEFVFVDGIPPAFGKELMTPNLDRSADFIARAIQRVPALGEVGIKMVYNGATSRTPDHQPLLGPVPGAPNAFIAAGYAAGIVQSGFTRHVAHWIVHGEPEVDLSELDARRFSAHGNRAFAFDVVRAAHAFSNTPSYPYGERRAGRPARTSALHDTLASEGAVFGVRNGWEVPNWFAAPGSETAEQLGFKRPNWFDAVGRECRHLSTGIGMADLSHLAVFELTGKAATKRLDAVFAGHLPDADGKVAFGPVLTATGGVATCVTVARLAGNRYLLIGPGEFELRDFDDLQRALGSDGDTRLANLSGRFAVLLVTGKHAGPLLAEAAKADLSVSFTDEGFPANSVRQADLGYAASVVIRRDETGFGDWLVLIPTEFARPVYGALQAHAKSAGQAIAPIGVRAWDALRLERGVPVLGIDIGRDLSPREAGLDHLVAWDKGRFQGREASQSRAAHRKLVKLVVDSGDVDPYRYDLVRAGGKPVGLVGSGGYGYGCRRSLALAVLSAEAATSATKLEVEVFGKSYPATLA